MKEKWWRRGYEGDMEEIWRKETRGGLGRGYGLVRGYGGWRLGGSILRRKGG